MTDDVPIGAHGAVDLSSLGARPAAGAAVEEVTEESFGAIVERSRRLPIVIAFWAEVSPASRELTTLLMEIAGTGRVEYVEWPAEKKAIDIGSFYADSTKFKQAVDWKQTVSLRDGLRRTVAFYREHLAKYL